MAEAYRADHVGSLLRPQSLLDARKAFAAGRIDQAALRAAEDAAIAQALDLQREAGIDVYSDGEFRRESWLSAFYSTAQGLTHRPAKAQSGHARQWKGPGAETANEEVPIPYFSAVDKITVSGRFTANETGFLKQHAPGAFKVTMPSPSLMGSLFEPGVSDGAYPDREALMADLIGIYQSEIEGQLDDGASYIQLDSLRYANAISHFSLPGDDVSDLDAVVRETVAIDNKVLAGARARGAVTAVHICRGNHRSAWVMSGGYEPVAERLLNEAKVDRFLLEFDDERSGGFEPLRFLPEGKIAVLGLVTTKVGQLESQEELLRRVDEAAKYTPVERLALSPQCGFASTVLGNLLSIDEEKRKLELVAATARRIWG